MENSMQMSGQNLAVRMAEVTKATDPDGLILEAWAQGYMVGSLIIMICITLSNIRRGVLLHKLIMIELIFGVFHGTFIFNHAPIYGWYLSVTAIFLNISWSLHNVIAWMKTRPFMGRKASAFFITTLILVQPYWVLEIYANFTYFNNINDLFLHTRPFEALFRDPWWIYTTCSLFYNIRTRYEFKYFQLIRISPRFGVMLMAMVLSIIFTIVDILSVTDTFQSILPVGINPFWKLAFVFKLLTDSVILDDFKTALDKLCAYNLSRIEENAGGSSWGTRTDATFDRIVPRPPPAAATKGTSSRSDTGGSSDTWIEVRTEMTMESVQMDDMSPLSPHRGTQMNP